ncbi:MAG: hypothetical protein HFJ52_04660 [Clostridia bacterium]|nr:hypothetical protein [Clostridia bacterium]
MKKVSKFTLYGIITVLVFLLVIQGLVIHGKQKELAVAQTEYNVSKEMYADLESAYNSLNEDYSNLAETYKTLNGNYSSLESTYKTLNGNYSSLEQDYNFLINGLPTISIAPLNEENHLYNNYCSNSKALQDKALYYYLTNKWDGLCATIDKKVICLDENGELFINGHSIAPTSFCYNHSLDTPPLLEDARTQVFILGDGTYRLENNSIIKYSKGKKVELSGGALDWTGMDLENYRPYSVDFSYDEENDKLYVIASSIPYDLSDNNLKRNSGIFLYSVPDRSKSEIEFIGQIRYISDGIAFEYDKSNISNIREIFCPEEIYDFEFSRTCAFADGYIRNSEAFPEGTFTHPVTTTPYVPLSQYNE